MNIARTLSILALAATLVAGTPAFAQTVSAGTTASPICLNVSTNIHVGSTDAATASSVTALQNFLVGQGYFDSQYAGTGRFGPITYAAVLKFQAAQGLPTTGYVGPLTRAAITRLGCNGNGGSGGGSGGTGTVSLYSINPSAGIVGSVISLTGFGFTGSNTILMDGSVAAKNVPVDSQIAIACTTNPSCHGGINQTIHFTVPGSLSPNCPAGSLCPMYMRQVTPGTYAVTVMNANGTSKALKFTVAATTSGTLSITAIDTPATLTVGQNGTWTVSAVASSDSGTLHYSVAWDDAQDYNANIATPQSSTVSTSATFTHAYGHSGTFNPTFTVTDDRGRTATVSAKVTVTPLY